MTKLNFNESTINSTVIPNIEDALNSLEKAISNIGILRIPNDFRYATYLKKLPDDNANDKAELYSRLKKLKNSISSYGEVQNLNVNKLLNLKFSNVTLWKK